MTAYLYSAIYRATDGKTPRDDALRLKLLDVLERHHGLLERSTEARQRRQSFLASIRRCAEGGKVAVVWGGRDCDGVRFSGDVRLVDATPAAVDEHIDHTYQWADGPMGYTIMQPSVALGVRYTIRDLTLEAFEDGHPHVIYD